MSGTKENSDFAEANRLTLRLERETVEDQRDGFSKNKFGMFEPTELRDKELEAYRGLATDYPEIAYYRYLLAGSCWRSGYLEEAILNYSQVADLGADYSNESVLMLACIFFEQGHTEKAQKYLDEHNRTAIENGDLPSKERIEDLYPDDCKAAPGRSETVARI